MTSQPAATDTYVCPRDGHVPLPHTRYDGLLMECPRCGYYPLARTEPLTVEQLKEAFD